MADNVSILDTIVSTLLNVGQCVVEISADLRITRIWNNDDPTLMINTENHLDRKLDDARNESVFLNCHKLVETCFATREKGNLKYRANIGGSAVVYSVRALPVHPDKGYILLVIENLSVKVGAEIFEDKWKLALDASGDGMWDSDLIAGSISFSEKWHSLFGYEPSEVAMSADWAEMIHPDDLAHAQERSAEYLAGKRPFYSAEMRYRCKDGTYKWILSRGVVVSKTSDGKPQRFIGTHTDITERKITEEKYERTAVLLSKLMDSLPSGILVTNADRKIIFANQMYCDIYRIDGAPTHLIGKDVGKNVEERKTFFDEPRRFVSRILEMLNTKQAVFNEELYLNDGRVLGRDYIPLSLGHNDIGEIWHFRDITHAKNAEKKLDEQRKFYERILNSIAADIVAFDAGHRYLFLNPVSIKDPELRKWMIGKTDEEYCIHRNKPLSIAERRKEIFNTVERERHPLQWEEKLTNPSGELEYHMRNMYPVFNDDGKLAMVIGYGLNITDLVLAREAAKTSRETFASAFDYSGIGMALIGLGGNWVDVNKVICDLTGYTKEELMQLTYHDITYRDDDEMDRPLINKLLNNEITTYTIEKRYLSKYKKIILVSLTVSLVWGSDDTPKFFIAQVVDITKKKELENEITRKNVELEATKNSLVNKVNQLEELSHIIAHNLRGPASNIKMLAGVLSEQLVPGGQASENSLKNAFTQAEATDLIGESSNALISSLETLMEIAEIKLNKDIPYNDCDIAAVVNDISTHLYSVIFEKHAVITLKLEVKCISYPKAYLENIFYNLVSNALKYSKYNVPPEITISSRVVGGRMQLVVKDNGMGIDMQKYGHKVFKLNQIFHQGYDSKGVGLYITKTQIESLGGTIKVSSKPNEGCEFTVTL